MRERERERETKRERETDREKEGGGGGGGSEREAERVFNVLHELVLRTPKMHRKESITFLQAGTDIYVRLFISWLLSYTSASRAEDPGFESCSHQDFSGSSHTSDSKIGTPVAALPGTWRYRVSTGTGRPGVSKL